MKQNIGVINALIRITAGFVVLSWATARLVRRPPYNNMPLLAAVLGAMKIGEGILRYCPLTEWFERQTFTNESRNKNVHVPNTEYQESYTGKASPQMNHQLF